MTHVDALMYRLYRKNKGKQNRGAEEEEMMKPLKVMMKSNGRAKEQYRSSKDGRKGEGG